MHRKSLIILFIFLTTLCITTLCFAADMSNSVKNVTNTMVNGVQELGSDVRNGVGAVENGIEGALDMNTTNNNTMLTAQSSTSTMNNDAYSTARVATAGTTNMNTTWVWVALVAAAIVIVGLVWYYGTQDNI